MGIKNIMYRGAMKFSTTKKPNKYLMKCILSDAFFFMKGL